MVFIFILIVLIAIFMKISSQAEERKFNDLEKRIDSGEANKFEHVSYFALLVKRLIFGAVGFYVLFKLFF